MTTQELQDLKSLLDKFISWQDELDEEDIQFLPMPYNYFKHASEALKDYV